ncbi:hypothetical protein BO70DRAFT_365031 [Aspergillus heteromorphus CBS 117.55]|uniref:Transmembrane protein n=1 Tax=Aspergillus heteromorphus CBS 117.55 TaxID=1448321 RepID=A0A317VBN7_9EURO|nr:uncharacterized protein BO70DRAFT_365031 [Aspergillus heteromorphus CBS 117.55]PWY71636.1 hypothetical protein BO70DRAFT_365031 [Aspergillus heteromorphus CBS 117.55]
MHRPTQLPLLFLCLTTSSLVTGAPIKKNGNPQQTPSISIVHHTNLEHEDAHSNPDTSWSTSKLGIAALIRRLSELTMRDYFLNLAVLVCIITICVLVYSICQNTMHCRRCRVDRAARREERQARRAYEAAARRLKWRQWWQGKISYPEPKSELVPMAPLVRGLPGRDPEGFDADSVVISEPVNMQTEIQGFRHALELVGDLVRMPGRDLEGAAAHHGGAKGGEETGLVKVRSAMSDTAASSTVGLATVMSAGTSSLKSLDCKSSGTLDTTDLPPPSYHS